MKIWMGCLALVMLSGLALDVPAQEAAEAAGAVALEASAAETDPDVRTLADWFEMGGWVMYLLVATSILSLIVILERTWATRLGAIVPRRLLLKIRDATRQGEVQQVTALVGPGKSALARVLRSGLVHFGEGLRPMEESVGFATDHESTRLRRNLGLLAALGNMATMMGLMGTVLGMIESFDLIAKTGTGDARVVAGGIFQALVTTAAGLMVGIFAIASHSFLRRKVESLEIELSEKGFRLLADLWLREARGSASTSDEDKDPAEI